MTWSTSDIIEIERDCRCAASSSIGAGTWRFIALEAGGGAPSWQLCACDVMQAAGRALQDLAQPTRRGGAGGEVTRHEAVSSPARRRRRRARRDSRFQLALAN